MAVIRQFIKGKTNKRAALAAVRAAYKPKAKKNRSRGREPYIMNAEQRKAELMRVVRYRESHGAPMGDSRGWAWVVGNLCRVLAGRSVDAKALQNMAKGIGLPGFDDAVVEQVVTELSAAAWGTYRLYTPKIAGRLIDLTRAEREAAGIEKIDAIDECREDRLRRLAKERKQRERAAKAAPRRINKSALAREMNVDRSTIVRWINEGRINAETGEVVDAALPVTASITTPYSYGVLPRDKTAALEIENVHG